MDCFGQNGPNNEQVNANIRDKIFIVATFMGVMMKREFREEYDKWEEEMEAQKIKVVKSEEL
jgi:flavorubredoxin